MCLNHPPNRREALRTTAAGLVAVVAAPALAVAADPPRARPEDVATIESLVAALYDVISGPKGQPRDWDRFRTLFAPHARLIPCTGRDKEGKPVARAFTADQFAEIAARSSATRGFHESEISRKIQRFGHIAHVFSTYESRETPDAAPFQRGINSFQLFWDDSRWWVVTIFWDAESPDQPIPKEYLG